MADVIITSSVEDSPFDPWNHGSALLLRHSAELDKFREHRLVEDPQRAEIILFAEMGTCGKFAERVRAHRYYCQFPEKCFLFDSGDFGFHVMPGIYASLTKRDYRQDHTRTGFYLYVVENAFINSRPINGKEQYLASFVGSSITHPVRRELFGLGRGDILTKDTSHESNRIQYAGETGERERFWSAYADVMADSIFCLCPRGRGAGSIRLYESMKMGRPPVIISDAWQPNDGVDWNSCSIRVPEAEVSKLPEILERHAERAAEMGTRARLEWESWFSERVRFHRVVELCLDIRNARLRYGRARRMFHLRHIPLHPRWYLSSKKQLYKNHRRLYW